MNWILASGSPRRRELLEMLGVPDLMIRPAKGPERATPGAGPEQTVRELGPFYLVAFGVLFLVSYVPASILR